MSLIQKLIIPVPALIFIALILLFLSNSNIAEADQNLIRELQEKISDRSNQIGAIEKEIEQSKKQLEAVGNFYRQVFSGNLMVVESNQSRFVIAPEGFGFPDVVDQGGKTRYRIL